jgi:DNA-binding CsgD family transcriptional regulator
LGADQSVTFDRRQQSNQVTRRLMERDEWQDELAASFAGLLPPSAVIIEGEPGLGKTAFLNAACHLAREAGHDVLYARGGALEAESPFGIVRQLFQPVEATLSPNEREMCANVTASLSDVRRPIPFEVIHDLYLNLAHFASSRPIVIAIDDLQWSDYESLVWVQYVARRLESGRISFIGSSTCRVAGTALAAVDNIIAEPSTRVFSLRPLSVDSVTKLVSRQLNVDSEDSFARACHTITGGNPFLLHSLLSALEREGFGPDVSEETLATLSPPPVARAILRRLGGLPEEAHALMQAAAILGDESDHRVVAALAGVDASMGSDMANALAEVYLLRRDRPLSFVYPLERSTVYGEIDPVRRARAHAEAARLLDEHGAPLDQVAHHLLLAEPTADEWSAQLLERAALVHAKDGQYEFAVRCLARSLDESPDASTRSRRLLELSSAEAAMGRPTALDHLREAAELGVDPIELADATYRCLKAFAQESYPPETVATLRHLEAQLGEGHVDLRIWIEIVLSTWDQQPPALPASTPAIESVLLRKCTERTRLDRLALAHLAYVKTFAPDQATAEYVADLAEQAVGAVDLQLDDCTSIVVAARAVASLVRAGRFEVADRLGLLAQSAALRDDQQTAVAEFSTVLAYSHFLQGNLDEAEIECRRSLGAMEGRSWASRPMSLGVLAATFIEEGRSREAASVLKDALPNSVPRTIAELLALEQRAKLKMLEGRIDEALKDLLLAEQGAEALGVRNPAVTSWRSVAATALCGAAAEVGDPLDRLELLTEAVGVLEPAGAALECAKATIDLGSVLISKGRQDEALSTLRRGADLAFRCRAQPLADRAARELRAAGARPRRLALMGSDALTPAERRVAELAAAGMINARIAEALFVSEKTVEGHLTRVYQKLGRRSRTNLREIFKPLPEIASTSASTELRAV